MVYVNSLSYVGIMLKENPLGCSFYVKWGKEKMFSSFLINYSYPFLIVERDYDHVTYYIAKQVNDLIRYAYNEVNHVGDGRIKNPIRE